MKRVWMRLLAVLAALSIVAAACAGEGGGGGTAGGGATGETGAVTTGTTGGTELGGTLVISNWDLYTPENLIPEFEAATGVDVELALHTTNEDIMGKIAAQDGGGFDLVFVSGPFAGGLPRQGGGGGAGR